jgi:hypothetical protein
MGKSRSDAPTSAQTPDETVGRRALLRRAATVAAVGIGGIAATEMLTAGPASAAVGDNLKLGDDSTINDAAGNQTSMTSSTALGASLEIANTGLTANVRLVPVDTADDYGGSTINGDPGANMLGGELLNLTEDSTNSQGQPITVDTLYWMAGDNADGQLENLTVVLTTATGTVFAPVTPNRILDTRSTLGRSLIVNHSALDSSGRLLVGQALELDITGFVNFAYAIHFNLTATAETGNGFLTAYPGGTRPPTSNLNYSLGKSIANSGLSPLSGNGSIFIYSSKTTHVLLDLQGWTLPDFSFFLNNDPLTVKAAGASAKAAAAAKHRSPVPGPIPNWNGK